MSVFTRFHVKSTSAPLTALITLVTGVLALAQEGAQTTNPPCSAEEASQFDFWVGEWDAVWQGGAGENIITREFDGCVIHERFRAYPDSTNATPLQGMSVSTYSPRENIWKQTWVDNTGSYLDFTGAFADGKMTLSRAVTGKNGAKVVQRMVWRNIKNDSFDWNWERSIDGAEFEILWAIKYTRRK